MKKLVTAITAFMVVACFYISVVGQTTTTQSPNSGLPAAIPDNIPAGVNLPFTFSGLSGNLTNVRIQGLTWSPNHTWSGDITATLSAPGGSPTATIFQRRGRTTCASGAGSSGDFVGPYTFRDDPAGSPGNFHSVGGNPVPSGQYQATRCVAVVGEVVLLDGIFSGPVFGPGSSVGKNFFGTKEEGLETFKNLPPEAANGTWTLNINDQAAGDVGTVTAVQLSLVTSSPTAANAMIEGRLTTAEGVGIRNATVIVSGGALAEPITVQTGQFGVFRIEGLPVGETYVVSAVSKRFVFSNPTRLITLDSDVTGLDFVSEP